MDYEQAQAELERIYKESRYSQLDWSGSHECYVIRFTLQSGGAINSHMDLLCA